MNWEATIAGIALVVSIGTAMFSYHIKLKTQHRQRMFEVSLVKFQSLGSAKIEISRISSDINRTMNDLVLSGGAYTGQDHIEMIEMIFKCHNRAVDEFKAVRHNLNETEADAFDSKITMYEKPIFDTKQQGKIPTGKQIQNLAMIPGELEVLIDTAIKNLQEEMAIK